MKSFYRTWAFWNEVMALIGFILLVVAAWILVVALTPGRP